MKKKRMIGVIILVLCLCCGAILRVENYLQQSDAIFPHVFIGNLAVGGLSKEEATFALYQQKEQLAEKEIVITGAVEDRPVRLGDLGVALNVEKTWQLAWHYGRTGNWVKRIQQRMRPWRLPFVFDFDEEKAKMILQELASQVAVEAVPANIWVDETGNIQTSPATEGRWLDVKTNLTKLKNFAYDGEDTTFPLLIEKVVTYPSNEDIASWQIEGVIASYQTKFSAAKKDRSHNLTLAAKTVDNKILLPQEEFSFNTLVGPRSTARGYRKATVISNNDFIEQLGGGICQVSSTLYNAVLRGGFPVTERTAHSLLIDYVPPGLDATVAYGALDFKFTNNRDWPVLIHTKVKNGMLTVSIYGKKVTEKEYRFSYRIVKTVPAGEHTVVNSKLQPGQRVVKQKGIAGKEVEVWRETIENGKVVEKVMIHKDLYHGLKAEVEVGPTAKPSVTEDENTTKTG